MRERKEMPFEFPFDRKAVLKGQKRRLLRKFRTPPTIAEHADFKRSDNLIGCRKPKKIKVERKQNQS